MLIYQVALVTETKRVDVPELMRVSAALQKQCARDFAPIWEVRATVDAFARLEEVPLGYWPVVVVDDLAHRKGLHLDRNGQPYALLEAGPSWSLTASHEVLEMLADPFGSRLIAGMSPRRGQGRVEFLVEVCDPCQDAAFAYTVNGILVSDFYTPSYFEPRRAAEVRYSFSGTIRSPRQVLRGGYLSWHDPIANRWFQESHFGPKPEIRDLGPLDFGRGSLRARIDGLTPCPRSLSKLTAKDRALLAAHELLRSAEESAQSKAATWRKEISELGEG